MATIDKSTVERTSQLANLYLSEEEKAEYAARLSEIVSYVEKINKLDTKDVVPTDHIAGLKNVFRDDVVRPSIGVEALANIAPQFENDHVVVPKIIDGDA